jgi:hypothetical protein
MKIIASEDALQMLKSESHCNCIHCQIAKSFNQSSQHPEQHIDEDITEDDLRFQQWDITQTGDKMFTVVNRLDNREKYNVYLGQPVGCTCGKTGCEHILAVLKS